MAADRASRPPSACGGDPGQACQGTVTCIASPGGGSTRIWAHESRCPTASSGACQGETAAASTAGQVTNIVLRRRSDESRRVRRCTGLLGIPGPSTAGRRGSAPACGTRWRRQRQQSARSGRARRAWQPRAHCCACGVSAPDQAHRVTAGGEGPHDAPNEGGGEGSHVCGRLCGARAEQSCQRGKGPGAWRKHPPTRAGWILRNLLVTSHALPCGLPSHQVRALTRCRWPLFSIQPVLTPPRVLRSVCRVCHPQAGGVHLRPRPRRRSCWSARGVNAGRGGAGQPGSCAVGPLDAPARVAGPPAPVGRVFWAAPGGPGQPRGSGGPGVGASLRLLWGADPPLGSEITTPRPCLSLPCPHVAVPAASLSHTCLGAGGGHPGVVG